MGGGALRRRSKECERYSRAPGARPSICVLALLLCLASASASEALAADRVGFINVDGAIGPATASYISRSIEEAKAQNVGCLVIQLNTPGGLLDSTQKIVQSFLGSPVPIVVYVAPTGATATSAGCFITLAANVAAMAPATTIGAAHPVSIGGFPGGGEEKPDETMKQKLENFSVSYMETIAGKRQRNVEWAKSAVKESASITAQKALELKVIDLIATDMNDLLQKLNGRVVEGKPLNTSGAQVIEIKMSPAERVFQKLWRPEVMFILMLVAIYGIIGELSSPGAILPGVVGAIALILALYLAAILPVNVAGLVLIALAMALFIFDLYTPTHGVLTVGGIIAFLIGSLMLFNRADPLFRLSLSFIIPATLVTAAFFVFVIGKGVRAQMLPIKVGKETLIGRTVTTVTPVDSRNGRIFVEGEYWNAVSDSPIGKDEEAEITAVQGLTLKLKRRPH
ncbi:MAG TPA: nodulation protein NfeD [Candidatus Udaeobacter sp.]|jgi:membrane-bound serine protease (ClpP class)|nr:nodulation protein NfeD [Candidatus Udaeobacter sp.]